MPQNPYLEFFENPADDAPKTPASAPPVLPKTPPIFHISEQKEPVLKDRVWQNGPEPLDQILQKIEATRPDCAAIARLLTATRAVDHLAEARSADALRQLFFVQNDRFEKASLADERAHFEVLKSKFLEIIEAMKPLAEAHRAALRDFVRDIDERYFSVEKSDLQVKNDIELAEKGIQLHRQILGEAARDLGILEKALVACERRLQNWVDAGGQDNLSAAELFQLRESRKNLTDGRQHAFDFSFFELNGIDRFAIGFGIFLKTTTAQYLNGLSVALDARVEK